jgi:hypothetical protein
MPGGVSIFPTFDGLPQVNTIATGATGSGRLVDLPVPSAGRESLVFVKCVRDSFRWDPTSALAADGISVVALLANGAAAGRYLRQNFASPEWMQQATWFIDPVGGNDENDATTAGTALKTDAERQRRMGPEPAYPLTEYHARYLNDVPGSDPVIWTGRFLTSTGNVYLHGSATNGQGKAVLATLAVDALTAENQATNTPLKITSNGLAVSWTADGLLNQRCRMTSGAALGGILWPALDLGAKQAQLHGKTLPAVSTFSNPFTFPAGDVVPALNDAFVVESLVSLADLRISVVGISSSTANMFALDSLAVSLYTVVGSMTVNWFGCFYNNMTVIGGLGRRNAMSGVRFKANSLLAADSVNLQNCYWDDSQNNQPLIRSTNTFATSSISNCVTVARRGVRFTTPGPSAATNALTGSVLTQFTNGLGIFNNTGGVGFELNGSGTFSPTMRVWGVCQAGGTPIGLGSPGSRLCYGAALPGAASYYTVDVTLAPSAAWISYRNSTAAGEAYNATAPTFDPATSIFTAYRTLTPANLQAAIAAGGFNGQFFDPITQTAMVAN